MQFPLEVNDLGLAKKVYFSILALSFLWLSAVFLAPVLYSMGGIYSKVATVFYLFFSNICHQEDARSYHIFGHIIAVCSRCVWIYTGFFTGTAVYPIKFKLNNIYLPPVWILLMAAAVVFLDAMLNIWEMYPNTFLSRGITGFLIGAVLPFYLIPGFLRFFYEMTNYFKKDEKVNEPS